MSPFIIAIILFAVTYVLLFTLPKARSYIALCSAVIFSVWLTFFCADIEFGLGTIVGAGTGIVCTLLGGAWSLIIISLAWLRFRPLIGAAMIGVAALLVAALYFKGRARKAAPAAPVPPAE